jgi:hypothetical protein
MFATSDTAGGKKPASRVAVRIARLAAAGRVSGRREITKYRDRSGGESLPAVIAIRYFVPGAAG